jgi:hypothetical protein
MNIGAITAGPAAVYCDLSVVEIALERVLSMCWDDPTTAFNLNDWREYHQRAEFIGQDCGFVLESESTRGVFAVPANPTVRATLRRDDHDDADWVLTFRRGRLVKVEGTAGAEMLADTAWRYQRLAAEGTVSANAIDRPPEWHEAHSAGFADEADGIMTP